MNADNIGKLPVIDGVNKLTILTENCNSNEKARHECAKRWMAAGRKVSSAMPEHGKDFNDDLMTLSELGKLE